MVVAVIVPMTMIVRVVVVVVRVTAVLWRRTMPMFGNGEFCRGHAGAKYPLSANVVPGHRQAAQGAPQVVIRETGIQEGAEHHVAGNPGETVEVQHAAHAL